MGIAAIAIRDETSEALQALMNNANYSQGEVVVSLSDVIDALLSISEKAATETGVLAIAVEVAAKN